MATRMTVDLIAGEKLLKDKITNVRSSHRMCSAEKGVLKNFANSTGKLLLESLFNNFVKQLFKATLLKRDSNTSVFL